MGRSLRRAGWGTGGWPVRCPISILGKRGVGNGGSCHRGVAYFDEAMAEGLEAGGLQSTTRDEHFLDSLAYDRQKVLELRWLLDVAHVLKFGFILIGASF